MMSLSCKRASLAMAIMLAAAILAACSDKNDSTSQQLASWDRLTDDAVLRTAEQAYRSCAREAALRNLPVADFPETGERVTYLTQDGKRLKRSEYTSVAIDDMRVDNGCAIQITKSVSVDVVSKKTDASIDESGRTVMTGDATRKTSPEQAGVKLAIARKALPASSCTPVRDASVQSHFMMLSLCRHEERRTEEARRELPQPARKAATRLPSS